MEIVVVFVDICPPEGNLSAYQHYQSFWWNDLKKLTILVKNLEHCQAGDSRHFVGDINKVAL